LTSLPNNNLTNLQQLTLIQKQIQDATWIQQLSDLMAFEHSNIIQNTINQQTSMGGTNDSHKGTRKESGGG